MIRETPLFKKGNVVRIPNHKVWWIRPKPIEVAQVVRKELRTIVPENEVDE